MEPHRTKQGHVVPRAKPTDMRAYRFGFNPSLGKWWVSPAEGASTQMILCDELQTCELDTICHPNGTQTCLAELLADGATLRFDSAGHAASCRKITLRLLRIYDQLVHVPVTAARAVAKDPA